MSPLPTVLGQSNIGTWGVTHTPRQRVPSRAMAAWHRRHQDTMPSRGPICVAPPALQCGKGKAALLDMNYFW